MPSYTPEQIAASKALLQKGDALGQQASQKTGVAYAPKYSVPSPTPIVSSEGAVEASTITPAPQVNVPTPTAPAMQETFQLGLEVAAEQARTSLDDTLATQRDEAIKRQEDASKRLQDILSNSDPANRATYGQEEQIVRNQLNAAENASRTIQEDFDSRRRIVGEMEQLLADGSNLIRQQQGLPVAQRVVSQLASRAIQDVQARNSILSAVLAATDGSISLAHSIINQGAAAVRAQWEDQVAYNNAVLQLEANKELAIEGEHKMYAEEQLGMAKSKLAGMEETIAAVKEAMINPKTARTYAEAGITLNDTIDEIATKLAKQTQIEEDRVIIGTMSLDALQNGASPELASQMREARTVADVMRIGGQYIGLLDRRLKTAQIAKIGYDNLLAQAALNDTTSGYLSDKQITAIDNSPQGKKLKTAAELKLKLSSYQSLVEKYGFEMAGPEKAVLQNAYTELQLAYKEAANLGVLNGPDLTLVESAIRSATPGFFGSVGNVVRFGGGTRSLKANLEQAQTTLNSAATQNLEELYARNPIYQDSLYVQSMILPFGDELITQAERAAMEEAMNQ